MEYIVRSIILSYIFRRFFLFQHNLNLYSSYRVSLIDDNFVIIAVIGDIAVDVILVQFYVIYDVIAT